MKNKIAEVVLSRYFKDYSKPEEFLSGEAEALRKILSDNPEYFYKSHDIEHILSKNNAFCTERTLFCVLEKL